jgi:hypothetical protein
MILVEDSCVSEINDAIRSMHEWDTHIGHTHGYKNKYFLSEKERARIIDAIRTDSLNAFQAEFIPDLKSTDSSEPKTIKKYRMSHI